MGQRGLAALARNHFLNGSKPIVQEDLAPSLLFQTRKNVPIRLTVVEHDVTTS